MTERTYQPTGTGLCADCGHDVGRHDGGHEFVWSGRDYLGTELMDGPCRVCRCIRSEGHPIHDVGRELLCPEEVAHD